MVQLHLTNKIRVQQRLPSFSHCSCGNKNQSWLHTRLGRIKFLHQRLYDVDDDLLNAQYMGVAMPPADFKRRGRRIHHPFFLLRMRLDKRFNNRHKLQHVFRQADYSMLRSRPWIVGVFEHRDRKARAHVSHAQGSAKTIMPQNLIARFATGIIAPRVEHADPAAKHSQARLHTRTHAHRNFYLMTTGNLRMSPRGETQSQCRFIWCAQHAC
jgi:hypothetical protein